MQRHIRKSILEGLPALEPYLDDLLPKKAPLYVAKCAGHISLVVVNKEVLFYQIRDQHYLPTLRILHKCQTATTPRHPLAAVTSSLGPLAHSAPTPVSRRP